MALGVEGMRAPRVVLKTLLLTVGTAGFVVCLTMLFQSMRAVMDVGGACASGGAFEIRQPCPEGVAWIFPVSIFAGLAFLAIGAIGVFSQGGPRPYVFAWSALFLALGWNFLDYGFDAPGGGTAWGWIVCGVVFVLMGGLPLLALLSPSAARWALWGPRDDSAPRRATSPHVRRAIPIVDSTSTGASARPATAPSPPSVVPPPPSPAAPAPTGVVVPPASAPAPTQWPAPAPASVVSSQSGDLVSRLERLAELHDRGSLDDGEYERAKDALLRDEQGEGGSSR